MHSAMYTSSSSLEFYHTWVHGFRIFHTEKCSKMALNGIFLHLQHGRIIHLLLGNSPTQNHRTAVAGLENMRVSGWDNLKETHLSTPEGGSCQNLVTLGWVDVVAWLIQWVPATSKNEYIFYPIHTHRIHRTIVYLPTWMADSYGKCR